MKGASTIFLQYFPLNMSIVWNNSLEEIGAKRSEYEKAAPSQYLHLGSSADEETVGAYFSTWNFSLSDV